MVRLLCLVFLFSSPVFAADKYVDSRICGEPARYTNGKIKRSTTLLVHFRKLHPCPATGKTYGRCEGWSIDHVIPLACGGCDSMENLQWLPNVIKSAAGKWPKDRWERKVNCTPMQIIKGE